MQPEITFIKKLIRMRKATERLGMNKRVGVMEDVNWLERHVMANRYESEPDAKRFILTHSAKVINIIPSGKKNLMREFTNLIGLT